MQIQRAIFGLAALCVVFCGASTHHAEATDLVQDESFYNNGLWLELGLGTPSGYIGAHYAHRPSRLWSLGGFVGAGESGTQVGTSLRIFPWTPIKDPNATGSLVVEASYSLGIQNGDDEHEFRKGLWHWAQPGLGMELHTAHGFSLIGSIGALVLIDGPGDGTAHVDATGDIKLLDIKPGQPIGPWMRLSLGYVF